MLAIYLFSLALGGVLIVASIFMGSHDHSAGELDAHAHMELEADHDLGMDHDLAEHSQELAGHDTWLPFLSLRFWTFGLAAFGLTGTLLQLTGISSLVSALVSAPMGLLTGTAVAWLFHYLRKTTVGQALDLHSLRGEEARVILPISSEKTGKIRIMLEHQVLEIPATTSEGQLLEPGSRVLLVSVEDGKADVVRLRSL